MVAPDTEAALAGLAVALGAAEHGPLSAAERALVSSAILPSDATLRAARESIAAGDDPLGAAFSSLRSPALRRSQGATYTPPAIVLAMLAWATAYSRPARIVDPGAGSGRFLVAAGRAFPRAELVGVELDPLAALLLRAHLAAAGLADRARVVVEDYRSITLEAISGRTLFVGNPPYVRHHLLGDRWKRWLSDTARSLGLRASALAGLHVHFFLATLGHARAGDYGAFVTAAEWLDVNYGDLVRRLFTGPLGGAALHLVEPTAAPFPDAITTAAITCFEIGARRPSVTVQRVSSLDELGALDAGDDVPREELEAARRWTPLTRAARKFPRGLVELGELCRVRRGQVTGANDVWIAGVKTGPLPEAVLRPTVTKAKELYAAGRFLRDLTALRSVIDLPEDLDVLEGEDRKQVEAFLVRARAAGAADGYIARHRRAWWSVGLYEPAPILATYMARRPPGFVRNTAGARHINIAHGIYPRDPMSDAALTALAEHLATHTSVTDGRTYAGGLTKFEPKEMERLLVPAPEHLVAT